MALPSSFVKDRPGQTRTLSTYMDAKKGKQVRLYIYEADEPHLRRLTENTGLSDTAALSMLISASLKAAAESQYELRLPLRLGITPAAKDRR